MSRRDKNEMKMNKLVSTRFLFPAIFAILFIGCDDNFMMRNQPTVIDGKTLVGGHEGPGMLTDHPNGDRYPYPDIIEKVYIPPYPKFDYMKCLAWRITWPDYEESADIDRIPTVFRTNGALNSFYFLNNVDPQNTYDTKFSIYYDNRVVSSSNLWDELDYTFNAPAGSMESVTFAKVDEPLDDIQYWVEERPQQFENHWPGSADQDLAYGEGDFFIYYLPTQNLFGGIRIVSMDPHIIEVYLAVPND
jgi:hypothetical protein